MSKKWFLVVVSLVFAVFATGCSVAMSAKKSGVSIDELSQSRTRLGVLAHDGVEIVKTHKDDSGNIIYEDYLVQKPTGSTARAVMHGVLDVGTLGLWEVVGTPLEGHVGQKDKVGVRIYYNKDETVDKIEILQ